MFHTNDKNNVMTRVVYHGVTSSFFGIGILLVSDLLDFRYFGRYRSPLLCILPPFPPPFFPKGGWSPQKGGHCPPSEEKGGHCPLFDIAPLFMIPHLLCVLYYSY